MQLTRELLAVLDITNATPFELALTNVDFAAGWANGDERLAVEGGMFKIAG